jgi:hypothetical protein
MRELLVREAHKGRLMVCFRVPNNLIVLHEHFYWPKMKEMCKEFLIDA